MNTTPESRLLELYDRVAKAPDAIDRLRKFILDLAVRGKLVEQDPEDEPQPELLDLAATDKAERLKPPLSKWMAAKLGNVLNFQYGKGLKKSERLEEGPVPVFGSNGIVGYTTVALTDNPSIIVGRKGSAGALNLCDRPSWTTDVAYFVEAPKFFDLNYLFLALQALDLGALGKGVKPGLSRADAYELTLSIPPLPEQHRIVAKVDELMALLHRLETTRTRRETTRDRLTTASLTRLTAPESTEKDFPGSAGFALDNLEQLTSRPDQLKVLRQTILNLAVQGKLVEQDPADEPAEELLLQIAEEKKRLGIKHSLSPLNGDEAPFELPAGWAWTRVGEICSRTGSGSTPRGGKAVYRKSGIPFLRSQNVYNDGLRLDDVAFIDPRTHERMKGTRVLPGDLLLNITGGSIGRCCRVPDNFDEANISQHVAIIRPAVKGMAEFLHELILSPYFQSFIFGEQTGAGRGGLPKNRMDRIAVALPPLAEQHRIVAKVDTLMELCDKLEAVKTTADNTQARLLEVLLHGSLAQDAQNREAA